MDTYTNKATISGVWNLNPKTIDSNEVISTIDQGVITFVKTQKFEIIPQNENQCYTFVLFNGTLIKPKNCTFIDKIPNGMTYIENSFKFNDLQAQPEIQNDTVIYEFGWEPGDTHTISFCVSLS